MSEREKIYNKTKGKCYYCGKDCLENKAPACPRCNLRKDTLTVEQFRQEIQKQVDRLREYSSQFRLALDYGLIEAVDKDVVFYYEKIAEEK